ncbi:MAG TPA: ATP-binding protein [Ohtaekwangia sp.]|nr:ATP-binding protein [Ohtaekwangia sp.]
MKISYFIFLGFVIILVLFSFTTYINFKQAEKVNENSQWFSKSTITVRNSNRFQRNILNMISGLRGYIFTGENNFLQSFDSAALENGTILKELWLQVGDTTAAQSRENEIQQRSLREIQALNDRWLNEYAVPLIVAKKNAGSSDSSLRAFNSLYQTTLASGSERQINARLQRKFRDFANYEYDLREARQKILEASIQRTRTISFYLTTFSVVIGLLIAAYLAYRISSRIVSMVKMADDIATGNYTVHLDHPGKDELGDLGRSLNHMAEVLDENISLLKRKNKELDQFAHIVSHDLKAPLRGIDNVVTWIEEDHRDEISPKVEEFLQIIKGRILRAENLIRGILSYARVDREIPQKEPVAVNQLMDEIIESVPLRSGLRVEIQPNLPVLHTERIPLQMIFTNLLMNAIKHHDKTQGSIKIYCEDEETFIRFFIEDNGPGIAQHYHDKIFVIFQTLVDRDNVESTGVGLAIVKKILDERKQSIKVISELGKGSIFVFTWPKN